MTTVAEVEREGRQRRKERAERLVSLAEKCFVALLANPARAAFAPVSLADYAVGCEDVLLERLVGEEA